MIITVFLESEKFDSRENKIVVFITVFQCPKKKRFKLIKIKLSVTQESMKLNYGLFFLKSEFSSLYIRSKIVYPPQPATFPTFLQACSMCNFLEYHKQEHSFCYNFND